jgi:hypothetical protein
MDALEVFIKRAGDDEYFFEQARSCDYIFSQKIIAYTNHSSSFLAVKGRVIDYDDIFPLSFFLHFLSFGP